jgi:uncharacterized protein (TIGR04255 family)
MTTGGPLPKFRRPPLIEVAHGVQFRRLSGMNPAHPGLFSLCLRDKYPRVQSAPYLPPFRETFGQPVPTPLVSFNFPGMVDPTRTWFVSPDDTMLVQLQPDRLLLNWRRNPVNDKYPHFETVSAEFRRIYAEFEKFVVDQKIGEIELEQCEVTYVNHITTPPDERIAAQDFFSAGLGTYGPEWDIPPDEFSFQYAYVLRHQDGRPYGRVRVQLGPLAKAPGVVDGLLLEITARGAPEDNDAESVVAFHELAHRQIVCCFAGITTKVAHELWEREI